MKQEVGISIIRKHSKYPIGLSTEGRAYNTDFGNELPRKMYDGRLIFMYNKIKISYKILTNSEKCNFDLKEMILPF